MFFSRSRSQQGAWFRRIALSLLAGLLTSAPAIGAGDGELIIPISTVRNGHGTVFVALYQRDKWLQPGRYLSAQRVQAKKGTVHVRFGGLRRGQYGVAVFHDENDNRRVDTNFLGLPAEGYGFSRHSPRFHKPKFDEVSVNVRPRVRAPIRLRY